MEKRALEILKLVFKGKLVSLLEYGNGYGYGDGSGYGYGSGNGVGYGDGYGSGSEEDFLKAGAEVKDD